MPETVLIGNDYIRTQPTAARFTAKEDFTPTHRQRAVATSPISVVSGEFDCLMVPTNAVSCVIMGTDTIRVFPSSSDGVGHFALPSGVAFTIDCADMDYIALKSDDNPAKVSFMFYFME